MKSPTLRKFHLDRLRLGALVWRRLLVPLVDDDRRPASSDQRARVLLVARLVTMTAASHHQISAHAFCA